MRVAVTGARGRLGRALIAALEASPFTGTRGPISWSRPAFDLDALTVEAAANLLARDRPEVVVHTAAWTDVDGCARDPELALRRNGAATGALAEACVSRGVDLMVVSTNEVFDGERTDRLPYGPEDEPRAINPYGASKLAAERAALAAYDGAASGRGRLGIVRTSWLHGPPGKDFPAKILAAARRARDANEPLRAVADEIASPTYAPDLADAICELLGDDAAGGDEGAVAIHHLVNAGTASRADWARAVLAAARLDVDVVEVPGDTWARASRPPRWGVLAPTSLPSGEPMRHWREAFADAVPALLRTRA